jgi:hypothetical protein
MNLPTSVVITGCESMQDLEQALTAARTFKPISDEEIKALLSSGWARNHQKFSESCKQDSHKKAQKTQNRKAKKFIERV